MENLLYYISIFIIYLIIGAIWGWILVKLATFAQKSFIRKNKNNHEKLAKEYKINLGLKMPIILLLVSGIGGCLLFLLVLRNKFIKELENTLDEVGFDYSIIKDEKKSYFS